MARKKYNLKPRVFLGDSHWRKALKTVLTEDHPDDRYTIDYGTDERPTINAIRNVNMEPLIKNGRKNVH